jgi:hypothetical protein
MRDLVSATLAQNLDAQHRATRAAMFAATQYMGHLLGEYRVAGRTPPAVSDSDVQSVAAHLYSDAGGHDAA